MPILSMFVVVAKTLSIASLVFLPVFMAVTTGGLILSGRLTAPMPTQLGGAAVGYISLLEPVLLGACVHAGLAILVALRFSGRRYQVVVAGSAVLLPITIRIVGWGPYLFEFPTALLIATATYAVFCAFALEPSKVTR